LVIKPFSPAKPPSLRVKGYTRHQNQVQPVRWDGDAIAAGFADSKLAVADILGEVLDLAGDIALGAGIKTGQGNGLAGGNGIAEERPDVQFFGEWRVEEDGGSVFPDFLFFEKGAGLIR